MCCKLRGVSICLGGEGGGQHVLRIKGGINMSGGGGGGQHVLRIKGGINMSGGGGGGYQHALGGYMLGGGKATCLAEGLLQQYNVTVQSYTLKTTLSK